MDAHNEYMYVVAVAVHCLVWSTFSKSDTCGIIRVEIAWCSISNFGRKFYRVQHKNHLLSKLGQAHEPGQIDIEIT